MKRVVVTGLGIVSSLGHTLTDFEEALRAGRSGIRFVPEQAERGFGCQVAGLPEIDDATRARYFDELALRHLRSMGLLYGTMPGCPPPKKKKPSGTTAASLGRVAWAWRRCTTSWT